MTITLESLLDRERIRDVINTYCQGVDRQDWAKVRGCFAEDAHHDHGTFEGDNDVFITFAAEFLKQMDGTLHHIGGVRIDIDGDSATSEATFLAYHRFNAGTTGPLGEVSEDTDWIVAGRYCDTWVRSDEGWLIKTRKAYHDWTRTEPAMPRT